jgi:hypothetical protein
MGWTEVTEANSNMTNKFGALPFSYLFKSDFSTLNRGRLMGFPSFDAKILYFNAYWLIAC